jgi:hypothetical protein
MKTNLIIGAGQLGSRHLQGLLNSKKKQQVYVLDPSAESLNIAKGRANEIAGEHIVYYLTDWKGLPSSFDLVIVATGANVRKQVVTKLLNEFKVVYLILEKVLFQDLQSYEDVSEIIKRSTVTAWVNHARRMFGHYQQIKQQLDGKGAIKMHVIGANWGLGCNGLHFIDLCAYLSGSTVNYISADWIDDQLIESKRPGYIEFMGTIKGTLKNNSHFSVSSFKGESNLLTVLISTADESWHIEEAANASLFYRKTGSGEADYKQPLKLEYQSSLTSRLADDLFSDGSCSLPTYEEARAPHELFIEALLKKYNDVTGGDTKICPIT